MTNEEKQEIVNEVLAALQTHGKTIGQLTPVTSPSDSDTFELSGGRNLSYGKLKELITAIITDALNDYVPADALWEYIQQYCAMVNDGTHLLNWQQSPIVILHTMGDDYDDGDFSALSQGENYYRAGWIMEANGQGGGINGETPKANVLYVNLANDTLYTWNGASFDEITSGGGIEYEVGTYAQAWAKSQSDNKIWPWLLVDTVSGTTIRKPIWHIGNSVFIDAAGATISIETSAPSVPTFSQAGGSVSVNTQVVITPAIGSVLYYKVNNGSTQTSTGAVTIAINQASMVIEAWCVNAGGSSAHVTNTYTADAPAAPTMSPNAGTITRGTVVTITATDGTLYYKVNNGATQTASGLTATVTCTSNTTTIEAWVEQSGMSSTHVTNTYSVPVPNAPDLSIESGTEVTSGTALNVTFSGGTLHYKVNNGATQTKSTSPLSLVLTSDTNIEAWVVDANNESSDHVTGSYTIAVDHKFVFKIKLSGDNSTEYVPVTYQPVTGFSSNRYTMSVDWGDGTVDNFTNKAFSQKECSHAYTGAAGDEKTITLRGSAIPALYFAESASGTGANSFGNVDALVAILENTLTCDTYITINGGCSSLSADALSNNVGTGHLHLSGLTSFPTGLLNHLSKTGITDFYQMFNESGAIFTAENMQELRTSLASATYLNSMFYGFKGTCALPNNLFDLIGAGVVTGVWAITHTAKSGLTGDAKALYDVLSTKVTSSAETRYCFNAASLTNRNQVPRRKELQ